MTEVQRDADNTNSRQETTETTSFGQSTLGKWIGGICIVVGGLMIVGYSLNKIGFFGQSSSSDKLLAWFLVGGIFVLVGAVILSVSVEAAILSGGSTTTSIKRVITTSIDRTALKHSIKLHSVKEIYDDEDILIKSTMVVDNTKLTISYNEENELVVDFDEKTVTLDGKNIEQVDEDTDMSEYFNYIKPTDDYAGDTIKFIVTFTNGENIAIEIIAEKTVKCLYNQLEVDKECINLQGMRCYVDNDKLIHTTYNEKDYIITGSASIMSNKYGPSFLRDNGTNMECKQICDENEVYDEEEKVCKIDSGKVCTDTEVLRGIPENSTIMLRHILNEQGECVVDICDTVGLDLNDEACNSTIYENLPHPDGITGYARLKNGCCIKRISEH